MERLRGGADGDGGHDAQDIGLRAEEGHRAVAEDDGRVGKRLKDARRCLATPLVGDRGLARSVHAKRRRTHAAGDRGGWLCGDGGNGAGAEGASLHRKARNRGGKAQDGQVAVHATIVGGQPQTPSTTTCTTLDGRFSTCRKVDSCFSTLPRNARGSRANRQW